MLGTRTKRQCHPGDAAQAFLARERCWSTRPAHPILRVPLVEMATQRLYNPRGVVVRVHSARGGLAPMKDERGDPGRTKAGFSRRAFLKGTGAAAATTALATGNGIAQAAEEQGTKVIGPGLTSITLDV